MTPPAPAPQDARLGRVFRRDPRNAAWPLAEAVEALEPRGRGWPLRGGLISPQRRGSCTGHSAALDLKAIPGPLPAFPVDAGHPPGARPLADDYALAEALYEEARRQDEWDGEDYDGSSVVGAARAVRALGWRGEFRWAGEGGSEPARDVLLALGHLGPVVLGTDWLSGMFDAGPGGLLDVSGHVAGGHAYLATGVVLSRSAKRARLGRGEPVRGEPLVYGPQSWGPGWGRGGWWAMWLDDLAGLLANPPSGWPGEARVTTVPFRR
jgi:hypothetical protein